MYKIKDVARRGSALLGAVGLLAGIGTSALPAFAHADALNPLTDRSLSLSSSSPGWAFTDGSGNSTYAGPNTGTNGRKTGNTFSFRTTSDSSVNAFTFQYCTTPAGTCAGPGDDSGTAPSRGADVTTGPNPTSDLNVVTDSATNSEVASSDYASTLASTASTSSGFGDVKAVPDAQDTVSPYDESAFGHANHANGIAGNFVVLYGSKATGFVNTVSSGWTMTASSLENPSAVTGKNNMMTLTNSTGITLHLGDYVKVIFFGTDKNYITNPGADPFFVKINDYNGPTGTGDTDSDGSIDNGETPLVGDLDPATSTHIIDGGVTVANVMNQSIQIQTKVLETMDFSVGTVDPDTLSTSDGGGAGSGTDSTYEAAEGLTNPADSTTAHATHGACDTILHGMLPTDPVNVLSMGNTDAEDSLKTNKTFATHSFWRLSSNSSGGATVYYAGNTLSNTEGDKIAAVGTTAATPHVGTEQFGLALDNSDGIDHTSASGPNNTNYPVSYTWATADAGLGGINYETAADTGHTALDIDFTNYVSGSAGAAHVPQLFPLTPTAQYGGGTGGINAAEDGNANSTYAFDPGSQTVPTAIATESTSVVNCVTGKMRYIADIAATTPAGIYTTKINYIAAPQY